MLTKSQMATCFALPFVLTGCADMALSAAGQITTDMIINAASEGRYASVGRSWRINEKDIRELAGSTDPEIAALANSFVPMQILPDSQKFVPFDSNKLAAYRASRPVMDNIYVASQDYFIFASYRLKESDMRSIAQDAVSSNGLILLRGLKNNSISDTFQTVKVMTDEGATVLLAPALMKRLKATHAPTYATVNVLKTGEYGCIDDSGKKCKTFHGQRGFFRPIFIINTD